MHFIMVIQLVLAIPVLYNSYYQSGKWNKWAWCYRVHLKYLDLRYNFWSCYIIKVMVTRTEDIAFFDKLRIFICFLCCGISWDNGTLFTLFLLWVLLQGTYQKKRDNNRNEVIWEYVLFLQQSVQFGMSHCLISA